VEKLLSSDEETWRVYGLCAAWCGVCNQWRSAFEELAQANSGVTFTWVDIEDEAETVGEVEVETFPTLLIARGTQPQFFGPVLPSAAQCQRLLASLRSSPEAAAPAADAVGLLHRLLNKG
jgi:thioredoxin 1